MRTLTFAVVFFACVGLALIGCTDKSQPVVAPTDQSTPAEIQGTLAKASLTHFTATDIYNPVSYGTQVSRGARLVGKGEELMDNLTGATDPRVNGVMHSWGDGANAMVDPFTWDGTARGKIEITVDAAGGGGVWKGTWEGRFTLGVLDLKAECHGIGGAVDGLQLTFTETFDLFNETTALINGYVREH